MREKTQKHREVSMLNWAMGVGKKGSEERGRETICEPREEEAKRPSLSKMA